MKSQLYTDKKLADNFYETSDQFVTLMGAQGAKIYVKIKDSLKM
jgi:hypothetical protein